MKTVYIETSIVSYLTARPSDSLLTSAWQKASIDWWETQRDRFKLYTSQLVLDEASQGDSVAAQRRLEALKKIPLLKTTDQVISLAKLFLEQGALPPKAVDDAIHIALAAVHELDYLLTWNCRHIDNAETKPVIRNICITQSISFPEICTPPELMGV
jgi:predicted nucleic acid-binding protein